ncbi:MULTISPECIES: hypothetical protein [unclassified Psychrobacter]|uniref:hypothetical protein n=1 Tax=unclassified Psychrobacter TaxID=196806 RepID=UPI0003F64AB4|nr:MULTISPECIES: hypothetical protein [unclassified Psychrobacter]
MLDNSFQELILSIPSYEFGLKDGVLLITLFFNAYAFWLNRNTTVRSNVLQKLSDLQKISISNPYVEDCNFTKYWSEFCFFYVDKENSFRIKKNKVYERFLIYEQYCEMVFNFVDTEFNEKHGNLKKLNKEIDFEGWVVAHRDWWEKSLYSEFYGDGYTKDFCNVIKYWMNKDRLENFQNTKSEKIVKFFMNRYFSRMLLFNKFFDINDYIKRKFS